MKTSPNGHIPLGRTSHQARGPLGQKSAFMTKRFRTSFFTPIPPPPASPSVGGDCARLKPGSLSAEGRPRLPVSVLAHSPFDLFDSHENICEQHEPLTQALCPPHAGQQQEVPHRPEVSVLQQVPLPDYSPQQCMEKRNATPSATVTVLSCLGFLHNHGLGHHGPLRRPQETFQSPSHGVSVSETPRRTQDSLTWGKCCPPTQNTDGQDRPPRGCWSPAASGPSQTPLQGVRPGALLSCHHGRNPFCSPRRATSPWGWPVPMTHTLEQRGRSFSNRKATPTQGGQLRALYVLDLFQVQGLEAISDGDVRIIPESVGWVKRGEEIKMYKLAATK